MNYDGDALKFIGSSTKLTPDLIERAKSAHEIYLYFIVGLTSEEDANLFYPDVNKAALLRFYADLVPRVDHHVTWEAEIAFITRYAGLTPETAVEFMSAAMAYAVKSRQMDTGADEAYRDWADQWLTGKDPN